MGVIRLDKVLVAEIGSTTTVINAFANLTTENPLLLGQGMAATTVQTGDAGHGLQAAIKKLEKEIGPVPIGEIPFYATSSAAGGLKMTVHGLVPEMTARAAREAALGAGAVVRFLTAGELTDDDWAEIVRIQPNIMLLAGGVEHGDRRVVTENAEKMAGWFKQVQWRVPVIYAGNSAAAPAVIRTLAVSGIKVKVVPNVYPDIDTLNVEPARRAIQEVFTQHITEAPGMQSIREMVNGPLLPTPGAVMEAAQMVYEEVGDVLVFDVGGATTDVHSVTAGSKEYQEMALAPVPLAKRTVEGDLGVYVNARHVVDLLGDEVIIRHHGPQWQSRLKPVPETPEEIALSLELTAIALRTALARHSGHLRHFYGSGGRITRVEGRDLSQVRWVIGTGGALTRLSNGLDLLQQSIASKARPEETLWPQAGAAFFLDRNYIMASLGVLSCKYRAGAWQLLRESLGIEN